MDLIDKILEKLEHLKKYLAFLEEEKDITVQEYITDHKRKAVIDHYLQQAIECCIDIAECLISDQRLPPAESARQAIEILGENQIIPTKLSKKIGEAASFRNILVHDYVRIDPEKIINGLKNDLGNFYEFIKKIKEFLS